MNVKILKFDPLQTSREIPSVKFELTQVIQVKNCSLEIKPLLYVGDESQTTLLSFCT